MRNRDLARLLRTALATGLLSATMLTTAVPASAAIDPTGPDLGLLMFQSANQVNSGGSISYTLTIRNTAVMHQECEPGVNGTRKCYSVVDAGGPVSGLVLQDTLPIGATLQSANANSGFSCAAGGSVTCSGGSLPIQGLATITLTVTVPTLLLGWDDQTITNSATINPTQSIDERTYANNSASLDATDLAPPVADLIVTNFTGGGTVKRGDLAMYTVTVGNIGRAPANGVNVLIDGGTADFNVVWSNSDLGPCGPRLFHVQQRSTLSAFCPGSGNGPILAPGAYASMTILVQMPLTYTGTWTMQAWVNPFLNVFENNSDNNLCCRGPDGQIVNRPPVITTVT